jgi:hypothetical protein
MQVTQYTDAIPVDNLQVGDVILCSSLHDPIVYISSIKKIPSVHGGSYLKFNIKLPGEARKGKVFDYFNSFVYPGSNGPAVILGCARVTVVRFSSPEETAKFGKSWKNIIGRFTRVISLYNVCANMHRTPSYYGIADIINLVNNDSKLQEVLEDKIADCIRYNVKMDNLIKELGLESVDVYKEFISSHVVEVARLVLNGESVLDIRNRVAEWKLAYIEKAEAHVRMHQAFTSIK